jgi:hypothetical protein
MPNTCDHLAGRTAILALAVAAVMLLPVKESAAAGKGCGPLAGDPKIVAFLIDTSLTVRYFKVVQSAWRSVVESAGDGDTLVLAVVKGDARGSHSGEFPYVDSWTFPCKGLRPPSEHRRERAAAVESAGQAFAKALEAGRPQRTLLFSSLRGLAKYFADHDGPRVLIVATDGLEDSDTAKFETTTLTPVLSRTLIEEQRTPELSKHLKGVSVWVVAGGTASDAKSMEIERFWSSYYKAFGADLPPHRYAGALLHYPQ